MDDSMIDDIIKQQKPGQCAMLMYTVSMQLFMFTI